MLYTQAWNMTDFLLQVQPAPTGLSSLSLSHRLQQTVTHIPIFPQQSLVFIWASSVGVGDPGTPPLIVEHMPQASGNRVLGALALVGIRGWQVSRSQAEAHSLH